MIDIAILVLLYNKEIFESETISTLSFEGKSTFNLKVVIWNNGPNSLKNKDVSFIRNKGFEVFLVETLHNESLSVIYNRFLSECQAERYIILDDDSTLNGKYLLEAFSIRSDKIGMPVIKNRHEIVYPKINKKTYNNSFLESDDKILTIGSGLIIGGGIVKKLNEIYGSVFDEKFYFYGIDTTFCLRLYNSKMISQIEIISGFEHKLSRFSEGDSLSDFRRLERSYDMGLTMRYYNNKNFLSNFNRIFKLGFKSFHSFLLRKKTEILFLHFLRALVIGKHYKNYKK